MFALVVQTLCQEAAPDSSSTQMGHTQDISTAYLEVDRAYKRVEGLEPRAVPRLAPPVILFQVRVELDRVLDLTNEHVQAALKTDTTELIATWRLRQSRGIAVPTQNLGRHVFNGGRFQAIRYPSARDSEGKCLAVFPERVVAPSLVEVFDPYGELIGRIP